MRYVHQHHNVAPICDCTVSRHYPLEANSATQSESSPDHTGIMMMGNPHERYCSLSWQMVSCNPSACPCNTHINLYCMTLSNRMYHHVALYSAKKVDDSYNIRWRGDFHAPPPVRPSSTTSQLPMGTWFIAEDSLFCDTSYHMEAPSAVSDDIFFTGCDTSMSSSTRMVLLILDFSASDAAWYLMIWCHSA